VTTLSAGSRLVRRAILASIALGLSLGLVELAFHLSPGLLPAGYRERFAMHGVELFHPGILETTPIRGVPLPLVVQAHVGPPPADLKELGVAPQEQDDDARRYPEIHLPSDANGFPNQRALEQADILFLGDSFGVALGALEPEGLQQALSEATGLTVYNLSIAGIGPVREEFLLERVGLELQPRCVVWFFYSGNDATLSIDPLVQEYHGRKTWAEAYADRRAPSLHLPELVRLALARPAAPPLADPLPGHGFRLEDGTLQPIWFLPDNLRQATWTRERWEQELGWRNAREVLARVKERCSREGVALLLVYVPTKAEVYLPHIEAQAPLVLENARRRFQEPISATADEFLSQALAQRTSLEESFHAFCEEQGVSQLSATPYLAALAAAGELGYLATDSHWQETGQLTLLKPLVDALIGMGVVEEERRIP